MAFLEILRAQIIRLNTAMMAEFAAPCICEVCQYTFTLRLVRAGSFADRFRGEIFLKLAHVLFRRPLSIIIPVQPHQIATLMSQPPLTLELPCPYCVSQQTIVIDALG